MATADFWNGLKSHLDAVITSAITWAPAKTMKRSLKEFSLPRNSKRYEIVFFEIRAFADALSIFPCGRVELLNAGIMHKGADFIARCSPTLPALKISPRLRYLLLTALAIYRAGKSLLQIQAESGRNERGQAADSTRDLPSLNKEGEIEADSPTIRSDT